ncbi:hypothetical protein SDC9_122915 [bioreactor metagenome]|uniref:Uncharacterized protein n=1 Tax=bioreactor metagenome TaxID=1076179 RepID=A0A645CG55_9ZZZZ
MPCEIPKFSPSMKDNASPLFLQPRNINAAEKKRKKAHPPFEEKNLPEYIMETPHGGSSGFQRTDISRGIPHEKNQNISFRRSHRAFGRLHRRCGLFRLRRAPGSGKTGGCDRGVPERKLHERLSAAAGDRPQGPVQCGSVPHARRHQRIETELPGRADGLPAGPQPQPA